MAQTPSLIDLPEPPSNPDTPTDAPGTPNSTTTSLSALSTTAIKDGQRGNALPYGQHHHSSSSNIEAERADRISRLAGLERVSTARPPNPTFPGPAGGPGQIPGYFDANGNPVYTTRMSTVGSASATGSAAGRTTTWASGSTKGVDGEEGGEEGDRMSTASYRDDERDRFSASAMDEDDGMSDDTSLVGFGEGAGSTLSGPTYSRSNLVARGSGLGSERARTIDGLAAEEGTPTRGVATGGVEAAERILRERLDDGETRKPPLGSPDEAGLGKFYFEEKK